MAMEAVTNVQRPSAATRLCARQRELADRLWRLDRDMRWTSGPLARDFADQTMQRQDDEVIDRLRAATEWELDQIDSALARIASGSYGICARCGEAIDHVRLEVMPQAALCAACLEPALTPRR